MVTVNMHDRRQLAAPHYSHNRRHRVISLKNKDSLVTPRGNASQTAANRKNSTRARHGETRGLTERRAPTGPPTHPAGRLAAVRRQLAVDQSPATGASADDQHNATRRREREARHLTDRATDSEIKAAAVSISTRPSNYSDTDHKTNIKAKQG